MELKPGYKQTEAGVIPSDWTISRVGDEAIKVGSGITPTGGETVYQREGHPFIRSQNVGWGTLLLDDIAYISDEIHESFISTEIEVDDVFLNITGASIGRSAIADTRVVNGNVNQHVCIIRVKKRALNARFLNYILLSSMGQRQIDSFQAGGNRQGLNFDQIRSFLLPLPPLPEQHAIAAALSDTDALLSSLDHLLAKKRDIKQAVMQQLLTGKQRLPGFSGEWEVKRLGEIGSLSKGKGLAKDCISPSGTLPAIPYTAIYTDFDEIVEYSKIKQYTDFDSEHLLVKGPVLLIAGSSNMLENIGKATAYVDYLDVAVGGDIILYKSTINVRFLAYLLSTRPHRAKIRFLSQGSTIRHVYASTFARYDVSLPTLAEQTAIAAVLSDMDAEIDALQERRDKTLTIKQGMMQELLTGRTRLV